MSDGLGDLEDLLSDFLVSCFLHGFILLDWVFQFVGHVAYFLAGSISCVLS